MYRASLLFAFFCLSRICLALPSDNKETIHINSDAWTYNYKTGVNEYTGHVTVNQGTTHLTADKLTTKMNTQRKIQEAIAYGLKEPAHYWTRTQMNNTEMHAFAHVIKYYPVEANVTLEKNVLVKQGENSFQGDLIHYNSYDQTIIVPELGKSRAVLVYNPS